MKTDGPKIQFLGGAGTVTGSKYLVTAGRRKILLDCGLFQGLKHLRRRNWEDPPFDPKSIDAVVLSHAHIDHSGYLPLLARRGFRGDVFCTGGTQSLLEILLPDSAHIQVEEAEYANRHHYSKHHPAKPLYDQKDAAKALRLIYPQPYEVVFNVTEGIAAVFRRAAHILGSATIELQFDCADGLKLVFTGDLGRPGRPMLRNPDPVEEADVLLLESTYGDRVHPETDVKEELAKVVRSAVDRGGALIIPAFAVGRTQELIWLLRELEDESRIPHLPTYIDSPMATDVTNIFCNYPEDHNLDMALLMDEERCPLCCKPYQFTRTPDQSKALNEKQGSLIIIAASGMATAGRVIHHLKRRLPDPRTTVLLVGFQAIGTRGRSLHDGADFVRIHGRDVPIRASVMSIEGLSAHADRNEIMRWLRGFKKPPRNTYLVHGEPQASESLAQTLQSELGWTATVPRPGQRVRLESAEE